MLMLAELVGASFEAPFDMVTELAEVGSIAVGNKENIESAAGKPASVIPNLLFFAQNVFLTHLQFWFERNS